MLTPKLETDGQVIIHVQMADLDVRIERESSMYYWILCTDTSGIDDNEEKEKSVRVTAKQAGQIICLICDGDDTDPNLYTGLEDIFGVDKWPLNLRPIP